MSRGRSPETPGRDWRVGPSDLGQALVRVAIVSAVSAWSWVRAGRPASTALADFDYLVLSLDYLACALALLLWSYLLDRRGSPGVSLHVRRVCGVLADVGALSAYTALGAYHALIVFPFFLTVIIGYGYRFGLGYLYLAILASFVGFGLAHPLNPAFTGEPALVWSYYLSLVCVPGYAALLLRRHEAVQMRLHEVNEARSRFIANISHELRTPLHTIISSAYAGLEAGGHEPLQQDTALRLIGEAARHLLGLVNRVLDIAAAQAGSLRLPIAPADLYAIIRAAVDICRPQAIVKGVACHCRIDPEVPRYLVTAGPQIQEVLINLLGNAIKFTTEGYALLDVGTRRGPAGPTHVVFRIVDTGPGIPAELQRRLFQPFTMGDAGPAREQGGTGLGLAISKDYVEALGGLFEVRSNEGTGTECEVVIPARPDASRGPAPRPAWLSCVVLAPYAMSASERTAFMNAGFDPLSMTYDRWRERPGAAAPAAVFIHRTYFDVPDIAAGAVLPTGGRALLVAYGVDREEAAALPLAFQSRAGIAAVSDLLAIRDLVASRAAVEATRIDLAPYSLEVLIVDDNLTNLLAAGHALRAAGHAVDCASSAEEALRRAASRHYAVALVDLHLPGTSGLDVVAGIRQVCTTPCAILTADVTAVAHDAALASGAVAVLTKPIAPSDLRAAVLRLAECHRPRLVGELFAEVIADVPVGSAVAELIAAFAREGRDLLAAVTAAAAAGDGEAVRRALHRLKACAAAMGADALLDRLSTLERAHRNAPDTRHDFEALGAVLASTVAAMHAAIVETPHVTAGEAG